MALDGLLARYGFEQDRYLNLEVQMTFKLEPKNWNNPITLMQDFDGMAQESPNALVTPSPRVGVSDSGTPKL